MGPDSSFNKPHAQLCATLIYSLAHAQDSTFELTQIQTHTHTNILTHRDSHIHTLTHQTLKEEGQMSV